MKNVFKDICEYEKYINRYQYIKDYIIFVLKHTIISKRIIPLLLDV